MRAAWEGQELLRAQAGRLCPVGPCGRPWGKEDGCDQAPSSWRELGGGRGGVGRGGVCIADSPTQGSERTCWARNDIPVRGTMWQGEGDEKAIWFGVAAFIMNLNICISNHS